MDMVKDQQANLDGESIDKVRVLEEAKQCFMATSVKTKKLVDVLTKCIFILLQGEQLTNAEATDLFFHITRLFQYKDRDSILRRLTYIGTKALSQQAENVYVVTSSLTTDVNSSKDDSAVRASALRALCQVSDASNLAAIEGYLKQSLVDKHPAVASAALTSLIRIAQVNSELVRRCTTEIQEALNSDSPMVQYHALALRYLSCKNDRLATLGLLDTCMNQGLKSPLAICLLIRIIARYISESGSPNDDETKLYLAYIRNCMNHRSEMVEYEAANAIVDIGKNDSRTEKKVVTAAVGHLRNFLSSSKPALRYASLRCLNESSTTSTEDIRYWSVHRIGALCRLHLLNKRYKPGDEIIGLLDFYDSKISCAKYTCMLQCEECNYYDTKNEFTVGLMQSDFVISIPRERELLNSSPNEAPTAGSVVHAVLSFLFYISDSDYQKALYEDKVGTIELGPIELETKLFSCDFPLAIHI